MVCRRQHLLKYLCLHSLSTAKTIYHSTAFTYHLQLIHINKISIMEPVEPNSFLTQIAQPRQEPEEEAPRSLQSPPQLSPEKTLEKPEEDLSSLRQLLTAFNSYDKEEKGLITVQNLTEILASRNISTENVREYHEMSLPVYENMASFDEFLFIFCLSEVTSDRIEEKYALCKRVDERLIEFLKLLNKYRKKSQKNGNYKEAKNSKNKIEEIRSRQLQRRNKYLKILYESEVLQTEQAQKAKFQEFCNRWDQFMNDYQATAADLVKKVRDRQTTEIAEYEGRTREQLASKMHFSKYLLELQHREKNLVKVQEYERAREVQQQIEEMRVRQLREKEIADEQTLELKLRAFRKQQEAAISNLLQKIQKDRNEHMRQRQTQTEKLMVRSKSQLSEIDHRFNETMKKIYEALHNLGLESQKNIRISKS